ncbi:hypothetical protein Tco_1541942 [Tanacetum coccineum]
MTDVWIFPPYIQHIHLRWSPVISILIHGQCFSGLWAVLVKSLSSTLKATIALLIIVVVVTVDVVVVTVVVVVVVTVVVVVVVVTVVVVVVTVVVVGIGRSAPTILGHHNGSLDLDIPTSQFSIYYDLYPSGSIYQSSFTSCCPFDGMRLLSSCVINMASTIPMTPQCLKDPKVIPFQESDYSSSSSSLAGLVTEPISFVAIPSPACFCFSHCSSNSLVN